MTDSQSISDDDISREGPTEGEEDRDIGVDGKDTSDVSDDSAPTEADENYDAGGEGPADVGDD
jgi:hypothetical protein